MIGAGLAGLAAADALAAEGLDVDVLEARDRVGGRVWSDRLETGALIERGGEFLTDGYDATERLAARVGCELVGMGIRYPDRRLHPDPGIDRDAALVAAAAVEAVASAEPQRAAIDVLAEKVADPAIRELFASRIQSATAHPIDDLEAGFLLGVSYLMNDDECRRVAGGNQGLAHGLARRLGARVHLRTPATAVTHDAAGVRVRDGGRTRSRRTWSSSRCRCRSCARSPFDPPLPAAVGEALARIRMSVAAKLAVPLRAPVAADAVMSVPGRYWAYTTPCDEIGSPHGRVVGRLDPRRRSPRGDRRPGDVDRRDPRALARARPRRGRCDRDDVARRPVGAGRVLGADEPRRRRAFASHEPVGRVVFAGEHTSPDWSGTIEGALRSGERAAVDVLQLVRSS